MITITVKRQFTSDDIDMMYTPSARNLTMAFMDDETLMVTGKPRDIAAWKRENEID